MKRILAAAFAFILLAGALTGGYFAVLSYTEKVRYAKADIKECVEIPDNAVYFLNTGSSDAIVLKSGEHLAMVDAGEDSDNPRGLEELSFEGYEQRVLSFIKSFADENGNTHLDFIVGTHAHSDHIGGFDTVINDESIIIDKAYLKRYNPSCINESEITDWDNQEVYDRMTEALEKRNIPVVSNIAGEPFVFGDFTITMLNTGYEDGSRIVGENDNSLAMLVEKDGVKLLLTGDLDDYNGDELSVIEYTGKIDILKLGHHSYSHSASAKFLKKAKPSFCIVTNTSEKADMRTIRRVMRLTKAPVVYSDDEQGVCVSFDGSGYEIYNHACIY